MSDCCFALDETSVYASFPHPELSAWVQKYLGPFFRAQAASSDMWHVDVFDSPDDFAAATEQFETQECLSGSRVSYPEKCVTWHQGADGAYSVRQQDPDVRELEWYFRIDPAEKSLQIHVLKGMRESKYVAARLIRSLLMARARQKGWVQLHASCFVLDDRAYLCCGDKRAGKTTLLLTTLARFRAGFVSNDRVLVRFQHQRTRVQGLPHSMNIRVPALLSLGFDQSALSTEYYCQGKDSEKRRFLVREICELLDVPVIPNGRLDAVLFPRFVPEKSQSTAISSESLCSHLSEWVLPEICDYQPVWDHAFPAARPPIDAISIRGLRVHYDDKTLPSCLGSILS